jgi:hypothetical protein
MKLAFCTEDATDHAVLFELAQRCVAQPIEVVAEDLVMPRQGGWTKALQLAPVLARAVFNSDAHGAVFVVDCDGSPQHEAAHDAVPTCRHFVLVAAAKVDDVLRWPRPGLPPLQFIFAVPVQVLETWLLLANGTFPTQKQAASFGVNPTERRALKTALYGTERPSRPEMMEKALPIARAADVTRLESLSPSFAHFAEELRDAARNVAGFTPPA